MFHKVAKVVVGLVCLLSQSQAGRADSNGSFHLETEGPHQIKVMSYNLHNLFDADHDLDAQGGHLNDFEFLPQNFKMKWEGKMVGKDVLCKIFNDSNYVSKCKQTDWTDQKYELKKRQLQQAILEQGSVPDILAVQEIENDRVAQELGDLLGYDGFILAGSLDNRGIDVGLFYKKDKLELQNEFTKSYEVKGDDFKDDKTRNILQVSFRPLSLGQDHLLTFFVNHWPSQGNPDTHRMQASQTLQHAITQAVKGAAQKGIAPKHHYIAALGDFNTLWKQSPNPFHNGIMDPRWEHALIDVQVESFSKDAKPKNPMKKYMAPETYWYMYENVWQAFDHIFISPNLKSSSHARTLLHTFRIVSSPKITESFPRPKKGGGISSNPMKGFYPFFADLFYPYVAKRTNPFTTQKEDAGYSDHFPVVVVMEFGQPEG